MRVHGLRVRGTYALSCFSRRVSKGYRDSRDEREAATAAAAAAADSRRGRMQGQRGEKKQPTARGGDKRETVGETSPSPSDYGEKKKERKERRNRKRRGRKREGSTEGEAFEGADVCVRTTGAGRGRSGEKEVRQSR